MRKTFPVLTSALLLMLVATLPAAATPREARFAAAPAGTQPIKGHYIVLLEEAAVGKAPGIGAAHEVRELSEDLARAFALRIDRRWSNAITGFMAEMSEDEARKLARHPFVASVEQDFRVRGISAMAPSCYGSYGGHPLDSRDLPTPELYGGWNQSISCSNPLSNCIDNWGIDRIDSTALNSSYVSLREGAGVVIVLFDTGITDDHPQFKNLAGRSRVSGLSRTFTSSGATGGAVDGHSGHGTHVAGIAAGRTYGVAKNAEVIAVKVCHGSAGNCDMSRLVDGFNYVTGLKNNHPGKDAVASLSANDAAWVGSESLKNAVINMINAGVQLVQSAGNQGADACNYSFGDGTDTIVVGGTDWNDARASASNTGTCVDIFAPGEAIVSASRRVYYDQFGNPMYGGYCALSGTSMAAPHVAGTLALYLEQFPRASPAQLRSWLIANARNGVLMNVGSGSPNRLLNMPY